MIYQEKFWLFRTWYANPPHAMPQIFALQHFWALLELLEAAEALNFGISRFSVV